MYVVMLMLAAGNWEIWIARYNLQSRFHSIDMSFLLTMPGRVLPTLLERREALNHASLRTVDDLYGNPQFIDAAEAQRRLDARLAQWRTDYLKHPDWQGLNYADWAAYQELQKIKTLKTNLAMNLIPQFALTFLGILFCATDVAMLCFLLEWQERAAAPADRLRRLVRGLIPGAVVLVALLLLALVQTMLLWSGQ